MKLPGFIFGEGTGAKTPEDLAAQRAIANAMMKRAKSPRNVGEGLDAASRSIMGALLARNTNKLGNDAAAESKAAQNAEVFGSEETNSIFNDFFGGGGFASAQGQYGGHRPDVGPSQPTASQLERVMSEGRGDPQLGFGGAVPEQPPGPRSLYGMNFDTPPQPSIITGEDSVTGAMGADMLMGGAPPKLSFGDIQPQPAQPPAFASPAAGNGGLAGGIVETAQALGIDPVDLATAISYETAGTFDPTKRGPTTQWGQHRGLIQFGQPQAQKYGVDWNDPLGSQLGANGAVAKYLRDTGVKPGMGLLDIYSAINAGGVGRYNRSDANNGGAPGTVRDKVEQQMGKHREKALALLGGGRSPIMSTQGPRVNNGYAVAGEEAVYGPSPSVMQAQYQPAQGQGAQVNLPELPPEFAPRRSSQEIMAFINQYGPAMSRYQREFAIQELQKARMYEDPMGRLQLRRQYAEAIGWQPPQAVEPKIMELADGFNYYVDPTGQQPPRRVNPGLQLEPEAPDLPSAVQEYEYAKRQGYAGTFEEWRAANKGGVTVNNNMGAAVKPLGTKGQILVPDANQPSGYRVEVAPGSELATDRRQAETAKEKASDRVAAGGKIVLDEIGRVRDMLTGGRNEPVTGAWGALASLVPGSEAVDARSLMSTIKARIGFDELQQMREASPTGGALGAVTEKELQFLQAVMGSLEFSQSKEQLLENLDRLETEYRRITKKIAETGDGTYIPQSAPPVLEMNNMDATDDPLGIFQ